jgi:hypothetical protein
MSSATDKYLTLTLQPAKVGIDAHAIINAVKKIKGIGDAGIIAPNIKNEGKDVIAWAIVESQADLSKARQKVEAVKGVESATPWGGRYAQ